MEAGHTGSLKLRLAKDINFHITLAEISIQSITVWMLRYLLDFFYLRFEKERIFSRPQASSAAEHQKICNSVMERNVGAARKAMRDHIRNVKNNVLEDLHNRLKVSDMTVIMPAGSVEIELKADDFVVMTGPVEICYTGCELQK